MKRNGKTIPDKMWYEFVRFVARHTDDIFFVEGALTDRFRSMWNEEEYGKSFDCFAAGFIAGGGEDGTKRRLKNDPT